MRGNWKTIVLSVLVFACFFVIMRNGSQRVGALSCASLGTPIGGYISENTTWSLDGSPYVVVSDVIVEAGVNLTIEPGVVARFTSGTNLVIDGALIAEGNTTHPITFTSNSTTPTLGDWGSIHFRASSINSLNRVIFGVVQYGTVGIEMEDSSPLISWCNISYCSEKGVLAGGGSFPIIEKCDITNNREGVRIQSAAGPVVVRENRIVNNTLEGVFCYWDWASSTDISNNTISFNGENGIALSVSYNRITISDNVIFNNTGYGIANDRLDMNVTRNVIRNNDNGIYVGSGGGATGAVYPINYNQIIDNSLYDFYNVWPTDVNATLNWWGTTNETAIKEHIYDYYDNYNIGRVLYKPYLVPPVANFTYSPAVLYAYKTVTFNASASFSPYGSVINYTWDFGDSNVVTTVSPVITHMYIAPSNYEITLTVADEFGLTNSTATTIEVFQDNIPPVTTHDYDNAWHNTNFFISLTAVDNESGIKEICYRINNGFIRNVSTYGRPFIEIEGSNNTLEYWSIDNAENAELPHKILTGIKLDKTAPIIAAPNRNPSDTVDQGIEVKVLVNITDLSSDVKNATLLYTTDNGSSWETPRTMSYNATTGYYETTIPGQLAGTTVKYQIVAYDNAGNMETNDNAGEYYIYSVIPELLVSLALSLFMIVTLLAVIVLKRKHRVDSVSN